VGTIHPLNSIIFSTFKKKHDVVSTLVMIKCMSETDKGFKGIGHPKMKIVIYLQHGILNLYEYMIFFSGNHKRYLRYVSAFSFVHTIKVKGVQNS